MMILSWVRLMVKDLNVSIHFYKNVVGLPVKSRHFASGMEIVYLGDGDTMLVLICGAAPYFYGDEDVANGVALGFVVNSLDEKISLLRENGYETDGVIYPAGSAQFFFAKDPDDTLCNLTNADMEHQAKRVTSYLH
jgi:catechol 2,3-dioxygenase-like lactoylglutathione lyase family enzyme